MSGRDKSESLLSDARVPNTVGIVTYVDEESAFFEVRHTTSGDSIPKGTIGGDAFRKSTGFGDIVEELDDFLSFSDEVVLDIERELPSSSSSSAAPSSTISSTGTLWRVSRVWLCPAHRPDRYGSVADYLSRTHPSGWPEQKRCHVPPRRWGEVIATMCDVLRSWSRVPVHIFRRIVDEFGRHQYLRHLDHNVGDAFESYIKTDGDLLSFVRTVPQYFFVDDRLRVCIYDGFDEREFEAEVTKMCSELPMKSKKYSLDSLRVINNIGDSIRVLKPMLKRARKRQSKGESPGLVVAVECLGVEPDDTEKRSSELSVVQVASMTGVVYLFDVMQCPGIVRDGLLAEVLESDAILKVVHDCSYRASNLFQQFDVILNNVFDTAIAYRALQDQCMVFARQGATTRRAGLKKICEVVGEEAERFQDGVVLSRKILTERPLTDEVIAYAGFQVYLLVPNVYKSLQRLIHLNWRSVPKNRCDHVIRECTRGESGNVSGQL